MLKDFSLHLIWGRDKLETHSLMLISSELNLSFMNEWYLVFHKELQFEVSLHCLHTIPHSDISKLHKNANICSRNMFSIGTVVAED
mmetsp:Transcript_5658/g.7814  ORF Transcript_5658/g.7814 Transcript_5658/m.7814 type:complete len:86 (+) Transcript_5658:43-300(+)